jgi:hypothetical protein
LIPVAKAPKSRILLCTGVISLAGAAAVLPVSPHAVERLYANGLYAAFQPMVTSTSNLAPFALFDVLMLLSLTVWTGLAARDLARVRRVGWWRTAGRVSLRTLVWAAAAYLVFLVLWGFNYRRVRLVEKLAFSPDTIARDTALALATTAVDEANDLHRPAHEAGWGPPDAIDPALAEAWQQAARDVLVGVSARAIVVGRPKRTLLDWYFRRAAVSGMTDPFFLETLMASDVLPFERPMVVAHEWSHLGGIAHEGDANFVAWLACVRGSPSHRYSAWLFLYQELMPAIARGDRPAVAARLGPGPRADLQAVRDRFARNVNPRVFAAGWRVYDSYLKANRVESGAASYAEVVRLVLGTRFGPGWTPLLR